MKASDFFFFFSGKHLDFNLEKGLIISKDLLQHPFTFALLWLLESSVSLALYYSILWLFGYWATSQKESFLPCYILSSVFRGQLIFIKAIDENSSKFHIFRLELLQRGFLLLITKFLSLFSVKL